MKVSKHDTSFHIAGFSYWDGLDVIDELKIGTKLKLKAEPTNGYDPKAVKIMYKDTMLGYIPRTDNRDISKFLQLGHKDLFKVQIAQIDLENHPEKQILVSVKIKEKK